MTRRSLGIEVCVTIDRYKFIDSQPHVTFFRSVSQQQVVPKSLRAVLAPFAFFVYTYYGLLKPHTSTSTQPSPPPPTTLFFRTVTHFALLGLAIINTTTAVPVEVEVVQRSSSSSPNSNSTSTRQLLSRGMNLRKECRNYSNTVDRSSGASPFWRDCVQIYKMADDNNGDFWMFMNKANEGENTLVKHGTCAFGVHVHKGHGPLGSLGLVGYQDVLEVLMATERMAAATWAANDNRLENGKFTSLDGKQITRRLRDDARVQSKGDMDCHHWMLHDETFWVEWGLYRA